MNPLLSDEDQVRAKAIGNAVDEVGETRALLVNIIQNHSDPNVQNEARKRLAALPKNVSPTETKRAWTPRTPMGPDDAPDAPEPSALERIRQQDPSPSGPLVAGFGGNREENPGLLRRMDTSLGLMVGLPEKRRQALVEFDKGRTGGIGGRIAQKLEKAAGDLAPDALKEHLDFNSIQPETLERYEREAPLSGLEKGALQVAGAASPGSIARGAGNLGARAAAGVLPKAMQAAKPGLVGMLKGAAGAVASGAGQAGATQLGNGNFDSMAETADTVKRAGSAAYDAGTNPVSIGLGALLGGAFGKLASLKRSNPDVKLIESRGGKVGPTTPGSGEAFDDPLVAQGISEKGKVTEEGIGRTGRAAARGTDEALGARTKTLDDKFHADEAALKASGALDEAADVTPFFRKVREMLDDPEVPRSVKQRLQSEILDNEYGYGKHVRLNGDRIEMKAEMANSMKKKLQKLADFEHSTKTDPDLAHMSGEARKAVDQTAYRDLNAGYAENAERIKAARRGLEMPEDIHTELTPAQERALATFIMRMGQDTKYAGRGSTPELEQALKEFPELQRYLDAPALLHARGRLEFGPGGEATGGLYKKMLGLVGRNIEPAQVRVGGPIGEALEPHAPAAGGYLETIKAAANETDRRRKPR